MPSTQARLTCFCNFISVGEHNYEWPTCMFRILSNDGSPKCPTPFPYQGYRVLLQLKPWLSNDTFTHRKRGKERPREETVSSLLSLSLNYMVDVKPAEPVSELSWDTWGSWLTAVTIKGYFWGLDSDQYESQGFVTKALESRARVNSALSALVPVLRSFCRRRTLYNQGWSC